MARNGIDLSYNIIRIMPDRIRGEFINIGIMAFSGNSLEYKIDFNQIPRAKAFFKGIENIDKYFYDAAKRLKSLKSLIEELYLGATDIYKKETKQKEGDWLLYSSWGFITGAANINEEIEKLLDECVR